MSSNNQLIIIKTGSGKFEVYINPCVDNTPEFTTDNLIIKAKTLEKAMEEAQKYQQENLIEYGIAYYGRIDK